MISPLYLSSLVPPTVDSFSRYNLRNANDIRMVEVRTNLHYQSFLPSVVRDWNSLDDEDRTSASVSSFKNRLNRNRTIIPKYYYVGERKLQVLHTRLRMKCSSLSYDFFLKNIVESPLHSGPQDQKSVIFSHSVISLNQLLQHSKNTANIFLTFRNHVEIFLSQNIMQNL